MEIATQKIDLAALDAPPALASVQRIVDGFKEFQVLRAGLTSGIFDWLAAHGPAAKPAIAEGTGLRGAHLGGFLQALEDLGLLARCDDGFVLAPGMEAVLCADSRWCQAPLLASLSAPAAAWSDMGGFMTRAWQPSLLDTGVLADEVLIERHPLLQDARRLAERLSHRAAFAGANTLLCFDAAHGLLSAALCQRLPQLTVTVVVPPEALTRTTETLAACGVAGRCRLLAGTPLDVAGLADTAASEGHDAVLLFHALYPVRKSIVDALRALARQLAPGGELCSVHWFCLEACESAPGGLRELDKAVLTDSHPLCHVEQFGDRLAEAGLCPGEREDLAGDYGNLKLHFGRAPAAR